MNTRRLMAFVIVGMAAVVLVVWHFGPRTPASRTAEPRRRSGIETGDPFSPPRTRLTSIGRAEQPRSERLPHLQTRSDRSSDTRHVAAIDATERPVLQSLDGSLRERILGSTYPEDQQITTAPLPAIGNLETPQQCVQALNEQLVILVDMKAERFYPEGLIKLRAAIGMLEKGMAEGTDKDKLVALGQQALQEALTATQETWKRQTGQALGVMEAKISELIAQGAMSHAGEEFAVIKKSFERALQLYYGNDYQETLSELELLTPLVAEVTSLTLEMQREN